MKEIIIRSKNDFDSLRNLSGAEYIILKFSNDLSKIEIPSISLKKFHGTIDIFLEDTKKQYDFKVFTENKSKTYLFFTDYNRVTIIAPKLKHVSILYQTISLDCHVHNEQDFWKYYHQNKHQNKFNIYLCNDILLSKPIPIPYGKINVYGNGHMIYGKKDVLKSLLDSKKIEFSNTKTQEIDRYVYVQELNDLTKWNNDDQKRVLFSLECNISNVKIDPIDLSRFYGTFIFLGNGKKLSHISLNSVNSNSIGLFSNISLTANFLVSDLTLEYLSYPFENSYECVGTILGSRQASYITPYRLMPGKTLFRNCQVANFYLPNGTLYTGYIAGKVDEFAECENCNFATIFTNDKTTAYGNQNYYDTSNLLSATYSNATEKRICFESENDLKRRK